MLSFFVNILAIHKSYCCSFFSVLEYICFDSVYSFFHQQYKLLSSSLLSAFVFVLSFSLVTASGLCSSSDISTAWMPTMAVFQNQPEDQLCTGISQAVTVGKSRLRWSNASRISQLIGWFGALRETRYVGRPFSWTDSELSFQRIGLLLILRWCRDRIAGHSSDIPERMTNKIKNMPSLLHAVNWLCSKRLRYTTFTSYLFIMLCS